LKSEQQLSLDPRVGGTWNAPRSTLTFYRARSRTRRPVFE